MSQNQLFEHMDKYNEVVSIFHSESDRAAAILAGSYLEVLLAKLLKAKFIRSPDVEDLFKGSGPLATFSARIKLSYALGLIFEETYRDLNLVRRIRNHFAHNIENASFEDPEVRSRCAELSLVTYTLKTGQDEHLPEDARSRFIVSVGIMTQRITYDFQVEWLKTHSIEIKEPDISEDSTE